MSSCKQCPKTEEQALIVCTAGVLDGLRKAREYARAISERKLRMDPTRLKEAWLLANDTMTLLDDITLEASEPT